MKSYKLIQRALLFVGSLVAFSCSQSEEVTTTPGTESAIISINAVDAGILNNNPTRALTDKDYRTTFVAGDKIGLFAVKDDAVVSTVNNIPLTYNGTSFTMSTGTSLAYDEAQQGATYYAYYPYKADLENFTPSATDPFAAVISNWSIGSDLDENYTKYDLMTGSAVAAEAGKGYTLNFELNHRLSLAVVELPSVTYKFTNTDMSDYNVPLSNPAFTVTEGAGAAVSTVAYYDTDGGLYRLLVKPETAYTIEGSFDKGGSTKTYTINITGIAASKYANYTVDGGAQELSYTLQVGDYFCADGSLVSKDETAPGNCIGVVYRVGTTDAIKTDHSSCDHALVYAVKRVADAAKWGSQPGNKSDAWYGDGTAYAFESEGTTIRGYEDTKIWMSIEKVTVTETGKEPAEVAVNGVMKGILADYRQNNTLPVATTDWYVPSYSELKHLEEVKDVVNASLNSASGEELWKDSDIDESTQKPVTSVYWTSTIRSKTAVVIYHPGITANTAGYFNGSPGHFYRFSFGF